METEGVLGPAPGLSLPKKREKRERKRERELPLMVCSPETHSGTQEGSGRSIAWPGLGHTVHTHGTSRQGRTSVMHVIQSLNVVPPAVIQGTREGGPEHMNYQNSEVAISAQT